MRPLAPRLAALVVAALVLEGCGEPPVHFDTPQDGVEHYGADAAGLSQVDDRRWVVAVAGAEGSVQLWGFSVEGEGWRRSLETARATGGETNSVFLVTQASGVWIGAYVFGTASAEVTRVTLDREGETGGEVRDGAWVLAIPQYQVTPLTLSWRMLAADGSPVLVGTGELPPQP